MKRGYADTPEGQIHYYTHGRGEPLLLLHATPRSARSYARMTRLLGAKFRCFAVDTLGFGSSDPLPAKATMEDLARSMIHFCVAAHCAESTLRPRSVACNAVESNQLHLLNPATSGPYFRSNAAAR